MTPKQRELLVQLIEVYTSQMSPDLAAEPKMLRGGHHNPIVVYGDRLVLKVLGGDRFLVYLFNVACLAATAALVLVGPISSGLAAPQEEGRPSERRVARGG